MKNYTISTSCQLNEWEQQAFVENFTRATGLEPVTVEIAIKFVLVQILTVAKSELRDQLLDERTYVPLVLLAADSHGPTMNDKQIATWWEQASQAMRTQLLEAIPHERCRECHGYHICP
jgi:hypothetical protein